MIRRVALPEDRSSCRNSDGCAYAPSRFAEIDVKLVGEKDLVHL
jgi:hypothetical protein